MPSAVFLHAARRLSAESLTAAFEATDKLTALDAKRAARRQSTCVVAVALEPRDAAAVARELMSQGASAQTVDDKWLALPRPRLCRKAELEATALVALDAYGSPTRVPWSEVAAIAVGTVTEEKRVKVADARAVRDGIRDAEYALQSNDRVLMDIVTLEPLRRFRIEASGFNYAALKIPLADTAHENLVALLHYIIAHADAPSLSAGANALVTDPTRFVHYESEVAFGHEVAWLLWRHHGPGLAIDGKPPRRDTPFVPVDDKEDKSYTERVRSAAASRVIADTTAAHGRHMDESVRIDQGIAAIAGLLTTMYVLWRFEIDLEGAPRLAFLLLGSALGGLGWWTAIRSWRSRRYWVG